MRLNAKQIAACTGGSFVVEPLDARALVTGLTWDSRDARAGDVYVALPGERVDGHDFIGAALRGGAVCALVMQPLDEAVRVLATELGACIIEVPDTAHAVADIAAEWRGHLHGRVIALTGSTGKTTTKNLVRDVLASTLTVVATAGNQNNELGVPKTLLAAEQDTQAVVVEMGMRGAGQLADLCDYVRPDWGLVVNVGESHIELLGSRENIAHAKAELLCALPEGTGRAFVNADDDYADFVREHARLDARRVETVLFDGSAAAAERRAGADAARPAVWAEQVELDEQGRPRFELHAVGFDGADGAEEGAPCALTLRGLHNVSNACAAAAVGRACGIPLAVCADALAHAEPEAGRQEVVRARGGFTVVNDAYNANPDSMRASLATFCALDVPGKHVAVLGDMGELGSYAPACHAGIGTFAATLPLDRLVCVGELSLHIADAAERAGMEPDRIVRAGSLSEVFGDLDTCVEPGDAVLVKASHFMGLERVVEGLVN
ncbi:UDP-N-acetylmuramoyl-tripeptide--D-alanyl-D-alanine ligase [Eggerthella guodeyinii]|uniref:UDP-N-acetylmuramoyl-tripeptide--D-alanyl-D-alanine ligase n=1 Tax=Eggerthella guodeyinii TaxID=2690837 RepID=A0A6L7IUV6_9ACTN|nr:UDP-N-acetylmuramoyl-tripeptide--D-alanyl-D-alanine ligase [Eggerthella guodeyinii]QOS67221.1 UDP-N-acetylmuramoyl-tripeptide--D-alanyl-D-alanine ligase [Eggerthella guodeyinii]